MQCISDPIVGLQVRRTDKVGTEAAFHGVEEYMVWADHWFAVQSLKLGKKLKKRIFVATDDPKVVIEAKEK
jgi:glycoprotein 6-alpha-L-fucosyltransferase